MLQEQLQLLREQTAKLKAETRTSHDTWCASYPPGCPLNFCRNQLTVRSVRTLLDGSASAGSFEKFSNRALNLSWRGRRSQSLSKVTKDAVEAKYR